MDFEDSLRAKNEQPIDWALCLKLANNKQDLAKEMLNLFNADIATVKQQITEAMAKGDLNTLYQHIHKLHGATCYCGVPRLKELLAETETALKAQDHENLNQQVRAIIGELDNIASAYKDGNYLP